MYAWAVRALPTIALLLLAGCQSSAGPPESVLYVRQLQPLLAENGLLAERILEGAAQVHDERASAATTAVTWQREIVPLAVHLHDQAQRLDAPQSWATSHQRLVDIWGERAEGYELLSTAIRKGDADAWRRGRAMADQAKLDEESWFAGANDRLGPTGIVLDQYP